MRFHPSRLFAPTLLLSAALQACGGQPGLPSGSTTHDLLARGPDAIFDQPGLLVPTQDFDGSGTWGPAEGPGWNKVQDKSGDSVPHMFTNQPTASLVLRATGPEARTVSVRLSCSQPMGSAPQSVTFRLNGQVIGRVLPTAEPTTFDFETPQPLWGLGENLFELEASSGEDALGKHWDELRVEAVEYGPTRSARWDLRARQYELPARGGLKYDLDLLAPAELHVRCRTSGPGGRLRLDTFTMDPRTGAREASGLPERSLPSVGGRVEGTFALVPKPGRIHVAELSWEPQGEASLLFEELRIEERSAEPRPPIVFISIDTFSARHLQTYGYERETAPHLGRLAREGIVFERCSANAPWTMPSYLSVMTGLFPGANHVPLEFSSDARLDNFDWWQVADNRWTLAEALRGRGYQTAGFVDSHWLSHKFRLHQGYDFYDLEAASLPFTDPLGGIHFLLQERVRPWLDYRSPELPFFLFLHALDAHGPYLPETPYRDRFTGSLGEDQRFDLAGGAHQTYGAIPVWMARTSYPSVELEIPPEMSVDELVARYDETILKVDDYLGRLFDELERRGLYEDAVIVVTGDHGESFEHGFYGHGVLWEDVIHVPLLVKLPRNEHGGRRVSQSVQLVDVYPTLYELATGKSGPAHLHGRSLVPLMRGEQQAPVATFCEGGHIEQFAVEFDGWKLIESFPGLGSGDVSLLSHPRVPREWLQRHFPKLVDAALTDALRDEFRARPDFGERIAELRKLVPGPYYELYELTSDPRESRDLYAEKPDKVKELLARLAEAKAARKAAQELANPSISKVQLSAQALDDLAAIGYGEGSGDDEQPDPQEPQAPSDDAD